MNAASPFSVRAVLALVLGGAGLFLLILWLIGSGLAHGPLNDGGSHGAGKGLTGYAALSALLERQGWEIHQARTEGELRSRGLVVLTPPADARGADLARIVEARRHLGPTLVITPKWQSLSLDKLKTPVPGAKPGWVTLGGTGTPEWPGFLDDVGVAITPIPGGRWQGYDVTGTLPAPKAALHGRGDHLVPLVEAGPEGQILAAFIEDGGHYPALDQIALVGSDPGDPETGLYPLVVVFDPDLLDNYGMARSEAALYALRLIAATAHGAPRVVTFDLSFNGFRRSPNLLTLAFTPPFLAATLCLLIAALIAGWRAFRRFGPPATSAPDIAIGKGQLVANAGGIVRRSGRLYLLGPPYAALVRDRLAAALALPRHADSARTEAAIDRALASRDLASRDPASRDPAATPFSVTAGRLRAARRPADLLRAAQDLAAVERKLKR